MLRIGDVYPGFRFPDTDFLPIPDPGPKNQKIPEENKITTTRLSPGFVFSDPDPNDNRRMEDRGKGSSPRSYKCQEAHFSQNVLCLSEATPTSEQSPALPAFHR